MTTPAVQPTVDGIAPGGDPTGIPARPTIHHTLRGNCGACGKWTKVGETTGKLFSHKPVWRIANERCPGSGKKPVGYRWLAPL